MTQARRRGARGGLDVLVTGGAGYIGAHVVRALAERGHRPVVLDDLSVSDRRRVGRFPLERVSIEDGSAVIAAMKRVRPDAVIHLAGRISVPGSIADPESYWRTNLGGSAALLLGCATASVRTFLFSSTANVYGLSARSKPISERSRPAPSSPYGASKLAFERLLLGSAASLGIRAAALRYFNAAGANPAWGVGEEHRPEEHLIPRAIRALRSGEAVTVYGRDYDTPDGTCVRDFIHVTDLADAHVRAIESADRAFPAGRSLNVGTGRGHSVLQAVQAVAAALGVEPAVEFLPRRAGDPPVLVARPSPRLRTLGWRARHSSLEEIVADAIAWDRTRE